MGIDADGPARPDSGIFGLADQERDAAVVLVPVPFAATVSYGGGAERGPDAILRASHQVDLYDWHFGRIYEAGICLLPPAADVVAAHGPARDRAAGVIERGGVETGDPAVREVDAAGELVNRRVGEAVARQLDAGRVPGVIGGDHSVPFGAIAAAAERHPGLGILHVDAHADLRDAYEGFRWSHASIMHNVLRECSGVARLVQVGIRDYAESELRAIDAAEGRVLTHFDAEWHRRRFAGETFDALAGEAIAGLPDQVWVSFDIDGLDPSLCPHTGTPVPGGLTFPEAAHLLATLAASGRQVVGFDLVEVAPGAGTPAGEADPDQDEWDANVGARLLYKLCGAALRARRG